MKTVVQSCIVFYASLYCISDAHEKYIIFTNHIGIPPYKFSEQNGRGSGQDLGLLHQLPGSLKKS